MNVWNDSVHQEQFGKTFVVLGKIWKNNFEKCKKKICIVVHFLEKLCAIKSKIKTLVRLMNMYKCVMSLRFC